MCGICGYVGDDRAELLKPMCDVMALRGPDDWGSWYDRDAQVGLGQRRLSIIDLSPTGHQPMANEDETVWITYNGEIYNFPELREGLIARGHTFRGRSDTEVLVHLYEEQGVELLNQLNGIFAFGIWDSERRQLFLARDHAGVKPLYYWRNGRSLFFASEIKALLRIPEIPRQLNPTAVCEYLTFLWVPGEHTMLKGIRKLEPGHCLIWRDGRVDVRSWFSLDYEPDESVSQEQWEERVYETFMRTTRRQMVSDVPLGAFLSGGTDSSSIVACMRTSFPGREITCYTVECTPEDEAGLQHAYDYPYAKRVAEILDVNLKSVVLRPDVISLLPKMVYCLDEPDADPAVFPSYLIAKLAREDGTIVLLSGTGGDEVFFGYRGHQACRLYQQMGWLPRWLTGPALSLAAGGASALKGAQSALARRLTKFRRGLLATGLRRHLALEDWSSPASRRTIFAPGFAEMLPAVEPVPPCMQKYHDAFVGTGELNYHSHMLIPTFLAAHNFLYTDKSSMATSVEVRVPFMDVELLRLCAKIPERYKLRRNVTKYILKRAMERHLPREILYRSKPANRRTQDRELLF